MKYMVHHSNEIAEDVKLNLCRFELLIEMTPLHNQFDAAGYVWAPYVPVFETPQIVLGADPFEPSQSVASRYATKMVDNRYYGVIQFTG